MQRFDLFVLGTGRRPAGRRPGRQAREEGRDLREAGNGGRRLRQHGDDSLQDVREAVLYLSGIAQRANYGASYTVKDDITMDDLLFRCHQVISREIDVIRAQMKRNGIALLAGSANSRAARADVTGSAGAVEVEADNVSSPSDEARPAARAR